MKCEAKPQTVAEPKCKKCGKPIIGEETELCYDCGKKHHHYIQGKSLWVYDETMRKSIAAFKYSGRREYARYYAEQLVLVLGGWIRHINPDVLVPVPLHKSKERMRGFNQAGVLAQKLAEELLIPAVTDVLIRKRNTVAQKNLNDKERECNLAHAFEIAGGREAEAAAWQCVMLIDDIYTTGSTMEACTTVLTAAGAERVYFITLCIGKGF